MAAALLLTNCHDVPRSAPPRAHDTIKVAPQATVIAVPLTSRLDTLGATLNRAVPATLWSIDQPDQLCVPPKTIKLLGAKLKTPSLKCRIVGRITRGRLAISGAGRDIIVTIPLHATVSAKDVGGILKQETAQADARVRVRVRLDLARDWTPRATAAISYDWVDAPHIAFLGQRIEFTSKADARLKDVIGRLERALPAELAKLKFRDRVAQAWRSAFTAITLNEADPPVWMRITPRDLTYGGYAVAGNRLTLNLGMTALTETFVGARPADPAATPLPPLNRVQAPASDILFAIPVIADYRELEPVLAKALARRAARPFQIPGIGPVDAAFGKVTIYGTAGGRIAVGLTFSAARPGGKPSHGTIWLTARPTNQTNSRRIAFSGLTVTGVTDSTGASLLLKLANTPGLSDTVAAALTQNFSRDYEALLVKVTRAIAEKRTGALIVRARITDIRTGQIVAAGRGLYLPVWGKGTARIELAPR